MKKLSEKDVNKLFVAQKITDKEGRAVRPIWFNKEPEPPVPIDERQVQVLEKIVNEIASGRQTSVLEEIVNGITAFNRGNNKNTMVLSEMISKIKPAEHIKKWRFIITRNKEGFIQEIVAEGK